MGAFCVFGISRTNCRKAAEKEVPTVENRKSLPVEEWGRRVAVRAAELFEITIRRIKVSPELDARQFCRDWLAAQPGEIKQPVIMVRGPKIDAQGGSDAQGCSGYDVGGVGRNQSARAAVR